MIIYNIPMLSGSSLNMAQLFELLSIEGVYEGMDSGIMTLVDKSTGDKIQLICQFTERQKAILKAGGLLKYVGLGNN